MIKSYVQIVTTMSFTFPSHGWKIVHHFPSPGTEKLGKISITPNFEYIFNESYQL